jgi:plasmid stabilization system protein ParE
VIVRFLAEAEAELDVAVAHYEAQAPGLGKEYTVEVRQALSRIEDHPEAWQRLGRRVRRYLLHRFPYGLIYAPLPNEIVIVAVMHLHRKPGYWRGRLRQV